MKISNEIFADEQQVCDLLQKAWSRVIAMYWLTLGNRHDKCTMSPYLLLLCLNTSIIRKLKRRYTQMAAGIQAWRWEQKQVLELKLWRHQYTGDRKTTNQDIKPRRSRAEKPWGTPACIGWVAEDLGKQPKELKPEHNGVCFDKGRVADSVK